VTVTPHSEAKRANVFRVLPLAAAWGRTVDFKALPFIYKMLTIRCICRSNYIASFINKNNSQCSLRWRCRNFCLIKYFLFVYSKCSIPSVHIRSVHIRSVQFEVFTFEVFTFEVFTFEVFTFEVFTFEVFNSKCSHSKCSHSKCSHGYN
jgi:hypothetical protein